MRALSRLCTRFRRYSNRTREPASSRRSIALSGRKRSLTYRSDNSAAACGNGEPPSNCAWTSQKQSWHRGGHCGVLQGKTARCQLISASCVPCPLPQLWNTKCSDLVEATDLPLQLSTWLLLHQWTRIVNNNGEPIHALWPRLWWRHIGMCFALRETLTVTASGEYLSLWCFS